MMTCDNCGGTGNDLGSLNPYYPDECPVCNGSGTEPEPIADYAAQLQAAAAAFAAALQSAANEAAAVFGGAR